MTSVRSVVVRRRAALRRASVVSLALVAAAVAAGCRCSKSSAGGAAGSASAERSLAPLTADSWLVELAVPGFAPAAAAVPLGAAQPRPVVIALHGEGDRPEWQCGTWTGITRSHAFVLCPRGVAAAQPERFGWASPEQTEKELRAALGALKRRFGDHVAPGPVVIAAFAGGVPSAVHVIRQEPAFFSRVVLVGAGAEIWTPGVAGVFSKAGGRRVLFVCSDAECRTQGERYLMFARGAGSDAKLIDAGEHGRVLDGRVASAIGSELDWLVAGDPRFPAPAAADAGSDR